MRQYSLIMRNKLLILFSSITLAIPAIVSAATETGGIVPCVNDCDFNSLILLVNGIINWFLGISVAVVAVSFCIAGAKIIFHPGSDSEREAAKGMFGKTVVGLLIVLSAWLIIHTVIAALVPNATGTNGALQFLGK